MEHERPWGGVGTRRWRSFLFTISRSPEKRVGREAAVLAWLPEVEVMGAEGLPFLQPPTPWRRSVGPGRPLASPGWRPCCHYC